MSELLRNSTNLDEGKVLNGFGCLFQVIFSFPLLSREGSSEKGAKEGKVIRNVYLAFSVLCIMFVIVMGRS